MVTTDMVTDSYINYTEYRNGDMRWGYSRIYPLVNVYKKLWFKSPFTVSMVIFSSCVTNYQRVRPMNYDIMKSMNTPTFFSVSETFRKPSYWNRPT